MTAHPESDGDEGEPAGNAAGRGRGRRPVVFQEAVEPARVDGILPVTVLTLTAVVVAVVSTLAVQSFRHTELWWLPGGAWAAVVIGVYGSWHVRRHRDRVRAREALTAPRE